MAEATVPQTENPATQSLTPDASFTPTLPDVQLIPIDKIKPSRHQARRDFDEEGIKALSEAVKLEGLLNPINVRPPEGDSYELIAGERRLRACKLLGWTTIPALITSVVSEGAASVKAGMENLQRQELNPIEEAEAFYKPLKADPDHWTQEKVAKAFGKGKDYVSRSLSLFKLPEDVQEKLRQRNFSREHGIEITRLNDKNKQDELANRVIEHGLTVKQTRKLVDQALGKGKKRGEGEGEGGSGDPLVDVWADLKHDPTIKLAGQWQVRHIGGYMWVFQVKPEDSAVSPQEALWKWFSAMAEALKPQTGPEQTDDDLIAGVLGCKKEDLETLARVKDQPPSPPAQAPQEPTLENIEAFRKEWEDSVRASGMTPTEDGRIKELMEEPPKN